MEVIKNTKKNLALIGDLICIVLITIVGFASHRTLETAGSRMWSTFLPLLVSWLLISPFLKLYDIPSLEDPKNFWRPILAMIFVAPTAAWMRGLWLQAPIQPVFILVLFGFSSLIILLWRVMYWGFYKVKRRGYG
jgi:Protein of unknown function (DUF3054)